MLKVNVRKFNREMYSFMDVLPIIVFNKKTGKSLFIVYPMKGGDEVVTIQPNKRKSRV